MHIGGDYTEQWYASPESNAIGRIRPDGSIEEFPVPTPDSRPFAIARESWSNGWVAFTEVGANKVGFRDSTGVIHEYDIPTVGSDARGISAPGPVYFTEFAGNRIGILRPFYPEPIREISIPTPDAGPLGITIGPGQPNSYDMWFTEFKANKIGRFEANALRGGIREYSIPTPDSGPTAIAGGGPEGDLFFLESKANRIGRITAAGVITEYDVPTPQSGLSDLIVAEGGVWFSERLAGKLGFLSWSGEIREFVLPAGSAPAGLGITHYTEDLEWTLASIWYLDAENGRVGRLSDNRIYAVGAGHGDDWDTEFAVVSPGDRPLQVRVGLQPVGACPLNCPDRGIRFETPVGEAVHVFASSVPYTAGHELYRIESTEWDTTITDLPDSSAWIVTLGRPEARATLPLVDYWTVSDAQPPSARGRQDRRPVLTFPAKRSAGVTTDVVLAGIETDQWGRIQLLVEAVSPSGEVVASSFEEVLFESTLVLEDVVQRLGLETFDGQLRVTRRSDQGLFWGVAEVREGTHLELVAPEASFSPEEDPSCCRNPRVVTRRIEAPTP